MEDLRNVIVIILQCHWSYKAKTGISVDFINENLYSIRLIFAHLVIKNYRTL